MPSTLFRLQTTGGLCSLRYTIHSIDNSSTTTTGQQKFATIVSKSKQYVLEGTDSGTLATIVDRSTCHDQAYTITTETGNVQAIVKREGGPNLMVRITGSDSDRYPLTVVRLEEGTRVFALRRSKDATTTNVSQQETVSTMHECSDISILVDEFASSSSKTCLLLAVWFLVRIDADSY